MGESSCAAPEENQSQRVVLDLYTTDLKSRNVIFDYFFTPYELLLKRNMTMTGTIRKKMSIPPILLDVKDKLVFSLTFAFTENTAMVSYIPKRNKSVILQNMLHNRKDVTSDIDKNPRIILHYKNRRWC